MQLKLLYMHLSVSAPFPGWCTPPSTAPLGPNLGGFTPELEWWNLCQEEWDAHVVVLLCFPFLSCSRIHSGMFLRVC